MIFKDVSEYFNIIVVGQIHKLGRWHPGDRNKLAA